MADLSDPISRGSSMKIRFLNIARDLGHDVRCDRPIVDIEITNSIITSSGCREYERTDICCLGIIVDDQIIQVHREPNIDDVAEFKREAISHIGRHRSLHAFNWEFEYYGLKSYLGIDSHSVEEIEPFKGKGWTKDKFFSELAGDCIVKARMPVDPFHGDSKLVFPSWVNGDIKSILDHNLVCLLKEHYILHYRDYLYKKYSDRIDAGGWYRL